MSIRKRGNIYWSFINIGGETYRETTGTTDKDLAEEFDRQKEEQLWREFKLGDKAQTLWKDVAARYLANRSSKTARDVEILDWFAPFLDRLPVKKVDEAVIHALQHTLLTVGTRSEEEVEEKGVRPLEKSTVNRYMTILKAVLTRAVRWKYLTSVPHIEMSKIRTPSFLWLTKDQFSVLYHHLPDHQKAPARIAVLTGLRMRSMLKLTWDRIDLDAGQAWIPGEQMKNGETFGVKLNDEAVEVLRELQNGSKETTGYVFKWTNPAGETLPLKNCNTKAFKKAAEAAGAPNLRWHDLRHTFASWAVQGGVPLAELMALEAGSPMPWCCAMRTFPRLNWPQLRPS